MNKQPEYLNAPFIDDIMYLDFDGETFLGEICNRVNADKDNRFPVLDETNVSWTIFVYHNLVPMQVIIQKDQDVRTVIKMKINQALREGGFLKKKSKKRPRPQKPRIDVNYAELVIKGVTSG